MLLRTASSRRSRALSSVLAALAVVLLGCSMMGCCESWEDDICGVMDPGVTECPSQEEFAAASAGEVKSGPEQKYYLDMRSDAEPHTGGLLCCYRVKFESCESIRIYQ